MTVTLDRQNCFDWQEAPNVDASSFRWRFIPAEDTGSLIAGVREALPFRLNEPCFLCKWLKVSSSKIVADIVSDNALATSARYECFLPPALYTVDRVAGGGGLTADPACTILSLLEDRNLLPSVRRFF